MYIDVSDKISNGDIHQYVSNMFVAKIQQEIVISPAVVGNKQAYYLTAPSDPGFAPRYVILGSNYSYDLGFYQNGVDGFMEKIKSDIFPTIIFN